MERAHWQRLRDLFDACVELAGAEREGFLREIDDTALREELRQMLRADAEGELEAADSTPWRTLRPRPRTPPSASAWEVLSYQRVEPPAADVLIPKRWELLDLPI